jgi:hypothetical protein
VGGKESPSHSFALQAGDGQLGGDLTACEVAFSVTSRAGGDGMGLARNPGFHPAQLGA